MNVWAVSRAACLFLLALSCIPGLLSAQPTASRGSIVHTADLQSDLAILRSAYVQLHPGLYRYNTPALMDENFRALAHAWDHDQSRGEAFLALSLFTAKIRCGHTYPNFYNQSRTVAAELLQSPDRLPFYFRWLNRRMVVLRDFTPNAALPAGTQVLAIDGVPTATILARLMPIARADGANDAKRIAYLAVTGDDRYEAFDIYFPLFLPQAGTSRLLKIQRPGHSPQTLRVETLTYAQRLAPIQQREDALKGGDAEQFTWKSLPNGSAYLGMHTWALYDSKWDWKTWLRAHINDAIQHNAPALIVDLRGNEGGLDVGNEIIARLITADTPLTPMRRLVRYRKTPADLNPYLDTWDKSFQDWGDSAKDLPRPWPTAPAVPYFSLTRYDDAPEGGDIIHPSGPRYSGRVFVLIDASNSSATFQFAQAMQQHHLGTLVGQTTGGSQRGINGGAFFFLRLPHSQLEVDLPLIATFPPTPQPDAGITPDVPVAPAISDIAQHRDPEMEAVARLIR